MSNKLILIFGIGVLIAIGFGFWQYSLAPQGMLLYTPVAGTKINYTPSSAVGFFVATLSLCVLSIIVSFISFLIELAANRRLFSLTRQSRTLALGFGLLAIFTMFTEKFWL